MTGREYSGTAFFARPSAHGDHVSRAIALAAKMNVVPEAIRPRRLSAEFPVP